jgi:Fic family protein
MSAGQDNNQELIREFKQRTNLSLRQIAAITGINKDKVNKFLREG